MGDPTKQLTLDERAKRNTTRLNNKTRKRYPLFAEAFATTPDVQRERLQRLGEHAERATELLRQHSLAAWQRGVERRAAIAQLVTPAVLAECDAKWEFMYGVGKTFYKSPEQNGCYYADHWWQCAKQHALEWAQTHCPNAQFHEWNMYRREGKCPTCGLILDAPVENVQDVVVQAALFE